MVERIDKGYQLFFKSARGETSMKVRPPSFRKVRKYRSYTLKQCGWKLVGLRHIRIGKHVYKWSKTERPLPSNALIKTVTIKRDNLNRLFVCFSLDMEVQPLGPGPVTWPGLTSG